MKNIKSITIGFALTMALGLSAATFAQNTMQNDATKKESCCAMTSCCCKGDSCPMKDGKANKDSCCCSATSRLPRKMAAVAVATLAI